MFFMTLTFSYVIPSSTTWGCDPQFKKLCFAVPLKKQLKNSKWILVEIESKVGMMEEGKKRTGSKMLREPMMGLSARALTKYLRS